MTISKKLKLNNKKLIYVGPTLSEGRLNKYQVFIGGLPKHLDKEFNACPQLKKLFVYVDDFINAEKQALSPGTPMNKYYKLAMEV